MAIAGRRWITNVALWSCIATSTGLGISSTLRIESALHPLSLVNIHIYTIFLASAGLLLEGCGPACISKEQAEISDPSGLTFVITETNCDLVGNTTATTIEAYGQGDSKTKLPCKVVESLSKSIQYWISRGKKVATRPMRSTIRSNMSSIRKKTYSTKTHARYLSFEEAGHHCIQRVGSHRAKWASMIRTKQTRLAPANPRRQAE